MHAADNRQSSKMNEPFEDRNNEKIVKLPRRDFLCKLEVPARDHVCGKEHLYISASDNRHRSSSNDGRA